jgi:DNA polymerase-3 subunit epsilon
MRQIVLDTETTGLEAAAGHRIIEIGCVELVNRRQTSNTFHRYVNPEREVDPGAVAVHGLDNGFLSSHPTFDKVAEEFLAFVTGAELVIHNADFDVGFVNHEFLRLDSLPKDIRDVCTILDTLSMARRLHPGQRNSLDALAKRYEVDNSKRELHGALLDAEILAGVYLAMTGGQVSLSLDSESAEAKAESRSPARIGREGVDLVVQMASADECAAHDAMLARLRAQTDKSFRWATDEGPT